ncbi:MAG: hypothetical protein HFF39_07095 [Lawsonibacter sp.]|nr:hypothetical protein [Lawsonibacter sp.]
MSSFMADLSGLASASSIVAKNSTSRKNNTELKMEDFLTLMVVQLQNQTMDDTADTSEMLNQMVQMQMVTALVNMTDASLMGYAGSLVNKEVTVAVPKSDGLEERVITVIGTGMYNGNQVIFGSDGETYELSQIMAVGRLPDVKDPEGDEKPGEGDGGTQEPGESGGSTQKPGESTGGAQTPDGDQDSSGEPEE